MNKDENKLDAYKIETIFLSFCGVGHAPFAPGTMGTLATMPFLYLIGQNNVPIIFLVPFFILILFGACLITDYLQKKHGLHDPQWIVIDEVLGMFTTFFFYPTGNIKILAIMFILFRFFDIIKIWPASYFDKDMKHGAGVILDDIVSGIFAGLVTLGIVALAGDFLM